MASNYYKGNTKVAIKIALAIKSTCVALSGYVFITDKPQYVLYIGGIGLAANEVINWFSDGTSGEQKQENNDSK